MRIVIWTDAFLPEIGGLEVFCLRLLAGLQSRGHTCMVIANCDSERAPRRETLGDIELHRFAFHERLNRADLRGFRIATEACERALAEFNPHVIHLNICSKGLLSFSMVQRHFPWPTVMTLHDRHLYRESSALTREILLYADAIVGVSNFISNEALGYFPAVKEKVSTIYNCLPTPAIPPAPFPRNFRFLAVGRLIFDKGFDLAIEALAFISEAIPDCVLTIVGDGNARAELEDLASERGVATRVEFLGRRHPDEIPALINECSALIMPSRWQEPFGLVALQAGQMARPICAARSGGLPEIIIDGETGLLFDLEDARGLGNAMRSLVDDPARAAQMGIRAHKHVSEKFGFSCFLDSYESLFKQVSTPTPGPMNRC